MLDFTTQRQLVEDYLGDNFNTCPIRFENAGMPKDAEIWISLQDKQTHSDPTGLGESAAMIQGNLIIGIFTPRGTGTAQARAIAVELDTLLSNVELSGINFQESEFHGSPGGDPNIPWYQMNLVFPYTAVMGQNYLDC